MAAAAASIRRWSYAARRQAAEHQVGVRPTGLASIGLAHRGHARSVRTLRGRLAALRQASEHHFLGLPRPAGTGIGPPHPGQRRCA